MFVLNLQIINTQFVFVCTQSAVIRINFSIVRHVIYFSLSLPCGAKSHSLTSFSKEAYSFISVPMNIRKRMQISFI